MTFSWLLVPFGHVGEALFFYFSIIAHANRVVSIESTHRTDVNIVTGIERDMCDHSVFRRCCQRSPAALGWKLREVCIKDDNIEMARNLTFGKLLPPPTHHTHTHTHPPTHTHMLVLTSSANKSRLHTSVQVYNLLSHNFSLHFSFGWGDCSAEREPYPILPFCLLYPWHQ